MKKIKFVICICLSMMLLFGLQVNAAETDSDIEENITIEEIPVDEVNIETNNGPVDHLEEYNIKARGGSKPSSGSTKNLSSGSKYSFDFRCDNGNGVYSKYNFYGISTMRLYVNASCISEPRKNISYTVKLFRNNTLLDKCVATYTRNTGTDSHTVMKISGLDTKGKYYFKIFGANYSIKGDGYVKKY